VAGLADATDALATWWLRTRGVRAQRAWTATDALVRRATARAYQHGFTLGIGLGVALGFDEGHAAGKDLGLRAGLVLGRSLEVRRWTIERQLWRRLVRRVISEHTAP
jgi:hypothetical protein